MRVSKGGTSTYCPNCKEITTCKAIPAAQATDDTSDYVHRQYYTRHSDIQFSQRGRQCPSCGHEFVSAEIDLEFLEEPVQLRDALGQIKANAEAYVKQSSAASQALTNAQ